MSTVAYRAGVFYGRLFTAALPLIAHLLDPEEASITVSASHLFGLAAGHAHRLSQGVTLDGAEEGVEERFGAQAATKGAATEAGQALALHRDRVCTKVVAVIYMWMAPGSPSSAPGSMWISSHAQV